MARIEYIRYVPVREKVVNGCIVWSQIKHGRIVDNLPQLFWNDLTPWREANLWAKKRATAKGVKIKTVHANFTALLAYSNWLEDKGVDWWGFPAKQADRCLVKYRGDLIEARDLGEIAPSTASQRMAAVVQFYRWLYAEGLLDPNRQLWTEKSVHISTIDKIGFERTIMVQSTDLAIPNRPVPTERLEDGLLPLTAGDRNEVLSFARKNASEELFLMLALGFFTGMRIRTITNLKIQTLERAVPDPSSPNLYRLAVGPGADPPVHTKFGVTGHIWIPKELLKELLNYVYGIRRVMREAKAAKANRDIVFLTRFGNSYSGGDTDKSSSINEEMHRLRKSGFAKNIKALAGLKFHQSRCTFATELARLSIRVGGSIYAVAIVREALLHRHESTSLKYIRFVEKTPIKEEMSNEFTREFLGVLNERNNKNT